MKCKHAPSRAAAFTLAEVMVATVVVALSLGGMIQAVVMGAEMLDVARKQTLATQLIHGQLDELRLRTWEQIDALESSRTVRVDASDHEGDQSTNVTAGFVFGTNLATLSKDFACERSITTLRDGLKQITYKVTWKGWGGRTHSRESSTYFGKNGLYVSYQRS